MDNPQQMRRYSAWVLGLTTLLSAPAAMAVHAPADHDHAKHVRSFLGNVEIGIRVVRPDTAPVRQFAPSKLKNNLGAPTKASLQADTRTGAIRLISGSALVDAGSSFGPRSQHQALEVAMDFLEQNRELLGCAVEDLVLDENSAFFSDQETFLKYRVRRDGLAIQDATIDFRFKHGKLLQVVNRTFGEADSDARPSLKGLDSRVHHYLPESTVSYKRELYRVEATKRDYRLVRVAEFDATAADGEKFVVQVEAATGKVFEVRPTHFNLSGSARGVSYPRWYTESLTSVGYDGLDLVYNGGKVVTSGPEGIFTDAPDDAEPKLDGFNGQFVRVVPTTGGKVILPGSRVEDAWTINFAGSDSGSAYADKSVAQSMTYYHVTKKVMEAKRYLQADNPQNMPWLNQQLLANVNLSQSCNAFWNGTSINFYSAGGGCANTALISDVIYHEWGHGLDANAGGIEDGAFSEGYGDIQSMIMTHSNILGIGFMTSDHSPVRDLEPDRIYPSDAGGGVHDEGLIIGSTFWDLFKDLRDTYGSETAGEIARNYAYKMIMTASHYTDVYDALLVIDDDNADLSDKTPNYCTINKNFAAHGLATRDEACNLAGIEGITIEDQDGDGHLEPGETVGMWMSARNASSSDVTGLSGTLSVNLDGIQVTESQLTWDVVPARGLSRSQNQAMINIDPSVTCGSSFTASIALKADTRSATMTKDFLVGRLDGRAESFQASALPSPIQDNQVTTVPLAVAGDAWQESTKVHKAQLSFRLRHSYLGDLRVSLQAPNGTVKQVWRGSGSSRTFAFDQDVSALFAGEYGHGTWKLLVADNASQDVGTIDAASLVLTPANFICD